MSTTNSTSIVDAVVSVSDAAGLTLTGSLADIEEQYYYHYGDAGKPWPTARQPSYVIGMLVVAYAVVTSVGVVSNCLVVVIVCTQRSMHTVTNYLLANLATADVLVCLFVLPVTLLQNIYTGMQRSHTIVGLCR